MNVLVSHSLPTGPATRHSLRIIASPLAGTLLRLLPAARNPDGSLLASREFPWGKSLLVRAWRGGQWPDRENRNTLWASQRGASGPRVTPGHSPLRAVRTAWCCGGQRPGTSLTGSLETETMARRASQRGASGPRVTPGHSPLRAVRTAWRQSGSSLAPGSLWVESVGVEALGPTPL